VTASAQGRQRASHRRESGHALLIVLVMCMVMIIGTTVAMKVWSTVIQRDREDELIFRGRQYAMALYLYRKGRERFPTISSCSMRRGGREVLLAPAVQGSRSPGRTSA
jgi:type II secretory pathway pseudopilin PulG